MKRGSLKKFLVISHEATLTGAPILLLRLMRLLRENGYRFNTLIMMDGPLANCFSEVSDLCVVYKKPKSKNLSARIKQRLLPDSGKFDLHPLLNDVDCVISNTIANGIVLEKIRKNFQGPLITYVHELEMATKNLINERASNASLELSNHFFVPCKTVKDFLCAHYKVQERNVSLLNYYIPENAPSNVRTYRKILNADFVVGAVGTIDWRKGSDLFTLVASLVLKKLQNSNLKFAWFGADDNIETKKLRYDINKLDNNNSILILNKSQDTKDFYRSIDLLLLPSREDAYPVVVLEAAMEKVPALCFNNSGGAIEFIEEDAGKTVPYLDLESMADGICNYYANRELLKQHGLKAYEKCRALHQNKDVILQQFKTAIDLACN